MNLFNRLTSFAKHRSRRYLEHIDMLALVDGYKNNYGYLKTLINRLPCDAESQPIPWFTYPALEYLESLDYSEAVIFEWGSGNSSRYFASRCLSIESIESDQSWYNHQLQVIRPNQSITYIELNHERYPHSILTAKFDSYDLIIVDGQQRQKCMEQAIHKIKNSGIIILDNSDWYPKLCGSLRDHNFIQIDFHGFGPINKYTWTTSVFTPININVKDSLLFTRTSPTYASKSASLLIAPDDNPLNSSIP